MTNWILLTPDDEITESGGTMLYGKLPGIKKRPHVFKYVTGQNDYEMWNLSDAEICAVPKVEALVLALTDVEWVTAVDGGVVCPWCGARIDDGHFDYCLRQNALATHGQIDDDHIEDRLDYEQYGDALGMTPDDLL